MGAFSQFRSKLAKKTEDEIDNLKRNPKVWNVHSVLNVLHSLVDKSNINKQLEVYNAQGNPDAVAGDFGRHSLYKMMGRYADAIRTFTNILLYVQRTKTMFQTKSYQ